MNRRQLLQSLPIIATAAILDDVASHDLSVSDYYDIEKHLVMDQYGGIAAGEDRPKFGCARFKILHENMTETGPYLAVFAHFDRDNWWTNKKLLKDVIGLDKTALFPFGLVKGRVSFKQFVRLKPLARYIVYRRKHQCFVLTVTDTVQRHELRYSDILTVKELT